MAEPAVDFQTLFNVAAGGIAFLGGWVVRNLQESMASLRSQDEHLATKVQAIELLVAGKYVQRDDLDKLASALFGKLDRIEAKVDKKLDREDCPGCKP